MCNVSPMILLSFLGSEKDASKLEARAEAITTQAWMITWLVYQDNMHVSCVVGVNYFIQSWNQKLEKATLTKKKKKIKKIKINYKLVWFFMLGLGKTFSMGQLGLRN